jgi:hypothetical protein
MGLSPRSRMSDTLLQRRGLCDFPSNISIPFLERNLYTTKLPIARSESGRTPESAWCLIVGSVMGPITLVKMGTTIKVRIATT